MNLFPTEYVYEKPGGEKKSHSQRDGLASLIDDAKHIHEVALAQDDLKTALQATALIARLKGFFKAPKNPPLPSLKDLTNAQLKQYIDQAADLQR